jgi:hypothetical protein
MWQAGHHAAHREPFRGGAACGYDDFIRGDGAVESQ